MKIPALFGIIVVLACATCTEKIGHTDNSVLSFDNAEEKDFDISELVDSPRFIRLETNPEALIGSAQFLAGEKYIIAVSRDKIIQFSYSGDFIRVLATRGKGPREFIDAYAFSMDEDEEKLYVDHTGNQQAIMVFDLNSGSADSSIYKPLRALGVENGFSLEKILVTGDTLYLAPRRNYPGEAGIYLQRTTGEFIAAIPRDDKAIHANAWVERSLFLKPEPGTGIVRYMSRDKDTLFSMKGTDRNPYLSFMLADRFVQDENAAESSGDLMELIGEGPSIMIFFKMNALVKKFNGGASASDKFDGLYIVNKDNFSVVKTGKLTMNGMKLPSMAPWTVNRGKLYRAFQSDMFKPKLERAMDSTEKNSESFLAWKALNEQITVSDNPVLFIGTLK